MRANMSVHSQFESKFEKWDQNPASEGSDRLPAYRCQMCASKRYGTVILYMLIVPHVVLHAVVTIKKT